MLLRRIIIHLRKQEWTAIAIDFVIVVLGVFIGIQVANWNDARADRQRADSYLERIHDDIEADIVNYQNRLAFWSEVTDYGRVGLAYADGAPAGPLTQWQLLLAYFQASQVYEFVTTDATYEELKSAGELGLIADIDLRNTLARYYTDAGNPALTERPAYRVHVRGVIPYDIQSYIWASCYASNENGEQQLLDCAPPADQSLIAAVLERIRRDEALMAELRYWMSTMDVASRIGRDRTTLATQVLAKVDAQLGN